MDENTSPINFFVTFEVLLTEFSVTSKTDVKQNYLRSFAADRCHYCAALCRETRTWGRGGPIGQLPLALGQEYAPLRLTADFTADG